MIAAAARRLMRRAGRLLQRPSRAKKGRIRRYIVPDLTVAAFFDALEDRGVSYVVLRWFDALPYVRPGGDVDILIGDGAFARIADLLCEDSAGTACDVYSASGEPGTAYRGQPYLPPECARQVLDRAVRFEDVCMVPAPREHFLSLAYHTVYQKGLRSGLPTSKPGLEPSTDLQHDYAGHLTTLARAAGFSVAMDMESLDSLLAELGWRPETRMLPSLSRRNPWIDATFLNRENTDKQSAPNPNC